MTIRYFDTSEHRSGGPAPEGMARLWSGLLCQNKYRSQSKNQADRQTHTVSVDALSESQIEDSCFVHILQEIQKDRIIFMELGAGFGVQSAELTGIIRNRLVETQIKDALCIAVEAEPTHFKWLQETFSINSIPGHTLYGAVDRNPGVVGFNTSVGPADTYGQAVAREGDTKVPSYSIDYLMEVLQISHVDLVHMDLQGNELEVILGATRSLWAKKIDYLIIATHRSDFNTTIRGLLQRQFECLLSLDCHSGIQDLEGFPKQVNVPQDGFLVLRRRGIDWSQTSELTEGPSIWAGPEPGPFPLIDRLQLIPQIVGIRDLVEVTQTVFRMIPWTEEPFDVHDAPSHLSNRDLIYYLFARFEEKSLGGWCGLHAELLKRILYEYGVKSRSFDFGLDGLSHLIIVVEIQGNEYAMDPYFGKYYQGKDHRPLNFSELMEFIRRRDFDEILPVYCTDTKLVYEQGQWNPKTGKQFEDLIMMFYESEGLKEKLVSKWGSDNPLLLMLNEIEMPKS